MLRRHAVVVFALALAAPAFAQDAVSGASPAYAGQWTAVGDAPSDPGSPGVPPASAARGDGPDRGMRGGHPGGMGEGGPGGMGGGPGDRGGGRHPPHDRAPSGAASSGAVDRENSDPALERLFARQVTISALEHPHRLRFDTGLHAVELSPDGGNVSGPGVGGTVALSVDKDALVVDSLSDSGYVVKERYVASDDGRRLELHATLRKGDGPEREIVRVFAHPPAQAAAAAK